MAMSIILLPLFSFFVSSLFGRFIGKKGSAIIAVFFMACAIVLSLISFFYIALRNDCYYVDLGM